MKTGFIFLTFFCFVRISSGTDMFGFPFLNFSPHQQTEKASISGIITDTKGHPLMYASVFLANTTLGTITDELGKYSIKNIPFGQHTLVVSYVGYDFKKISINVNRAGLTQNLQLKKSTVEIDAVEVQTKKSKNKWKQNFKKFERSFIGVSGNANSCTITNPKVLIFHYNKEKRILSAKARDVLIIENKGLGYTIQYVLENFEYHKNGSLFSYMGSAQFIPMEARSTGEAEIWKRNREEAYKGSFQHFLSTLARDTFIKEGFVLQSGNSMYPVENEKEVDQILKHHSDPLGSEIQIYPGRYYYERRCWFSGILHVIYTKESEGYTYGATRDPRYQLKAFQQSWIKIQGKDILFNIMGYLNDPNNVVVYGYWAFENIAEALPQDYLPE
jgi:hypothetical protein